MADIGEAIYSRLSGDSTLSNLLNGGVHANTPRETPSRPYVVYQVISGAQRPHAMGSDPKLVNDRIQVDIYADDYATMIDVDDEVVRLLSRWRGVEASVTIGATFHVDRRDFYEDDTEFHRRSNDFEFHWYE